MNIRNEIVLKGIKKLIGDSRKLIGCHQQKKTYHILIEHGLDDIEVWTTGDPTDKDSGSSSRGTCKDAYELLKDVFEPTIKPLVGIIDEIVTFDDEVAFLYGVVLDQQCWLPTEDALDVIRLNINEVYWEDEAMAQKYIARVDAFEEIYESTKG